MNGPWSLPEPLTHPIAGLAIAVCLVCTGCGEGEPEIRRYREISALPAAPAQAAAVPAGVPSMPAPPLAWTAPEGWGERPGGNMRIATFLTAGGRECTLAAFPGDVGGLEANVQRWLGQLQIAPPSAEGLGRFLAGAEALSTEVGLEGLLLDFRKLAGAEGDAMLAGVFEKDGFTIFVKMVAPADVLAAEEGRFRALCRSLR